MAAGDAVEVTGDGKCLIHRCIDESPSAELWNHTAVLCEQAEVERNADGRAELWGRMFSTWTSLHRTPLTLSSR